MARGTRDEVATDPPVLHFTTRISAHQSGDQANAYVRTTTAGIHTTDTASCRALLLLLVCAPSNDQLPRGVVIHRL